MKVTDLSSTHKKYIKKYGAKKAAEKYNLNLTSAKKYEKQYNKNSYKGKRTLGKKSKDSEVDIDFEDVDAPSATNSIGAALGFNADEALPDPTGMSGPQMPAMGEMNSLGSALGGAMGAMPPMAGSMPGAMPPMAQGMDMSGAMSPTMSALSPSMASMGGMSGAMPPMAGMPGAGDMNMNGVPDSMEMPLGGAMPPMAGAMPPMAGAMPGMFNGQTIDPSNVDPLMVQVSAPYNQQMAQQMPNLPMTSGAMIGGGEGKPARKIDLSKLAFF